MKSGHHYLPNVYPNMSEKRYRKVYNALKSGIQLGTYTVDAYLPSENELCDTYGITRTTVRRALDELLKEGFIQKEHGKGSKVVERRKSLGLLSVKGFSEAVGESVKTLFLQRPIEKNWDNEITIEVEPELKKGSCYYFERLRFVDEKPVMHEKNWLPSTGLEDFTNTFFVEDSFFKTLSSRYLIEVVGSTSEIRAEFASKNDAELLNIEQGFPILHISIVFFTSKPKLKIYSELYCNTREFPVGNSFHL